MKRVSLLSIFKRTTALMMIALMLVNAFPAGSFVREVKAAGSQFNVNLSSIGAAWATYNANISGGTIVTTDDGEAMIAITISDADLQSAIDLGTVSMSSALNVTVAGLISDPAPPDTHNTTLSVRFGSSYNFV